MRDPHPEQIRPERARPLLVRVVEKWPNRPIHGRVRTESLSHGAALHSAGARRLAKGMLTTHCPQSDSRLGCAHQAGLV